MAELFSSFGTKGGSIEGVLTEAPSPSWWKRRWRAENNLSLPAYDERNIETEEAR